MIKVENGVAKREPIPNFLDQKDTPEARASLLDLSWTDPTFGLLDAAWWPEEDVSGELGTNKKWGSESFELDIARKVILVTREQIELSATELEEIKQRQSLSDSFERDRLLTEAAFRMIPLQDAIDLEQATPEEIALLKKWKQYRVALNRLVLPVDNWPVTPQ